MSGWTARDLATALGLPAPADDTVFGEVATDTRSLAPGTVFVALVGERFDGHDFLATAAAAGATAAVVRQGTAAVPGLRLLEGPDTRVALGRLATHRRRRVGGPVVANTGTNGKTATKEMGAAVLGAFRRAPFSAATDLLAAATGATACIAVSAAPLASPPLASPCLADSLAKHPKLFDELFVSMVRAGELAGNLDEVLTRLADFLESSQKLKSKIQGAMIYPMVMVVVGGGIMAVLMIKVIPEITSMFTSQGKVLPRNTRFLIGSSNFLGKYWLWIFFSLIAGTNLFRRWKHLQIGRIDGGTPPPRADVSSAIRSFPAAI